MTPARYQRHFLKALALIHSVTCWIYELAIMSISPLDFPKSSWLSKWTDIAWYGTYNVAWCLHSPKMRNQSFYGKFWRPAEAGMIQELISEFYLISVRPPCSSNWWRTFPTVALLLDWTPNTKPSQGRTVLAGSSQWRNNTEWRMFARSLAGETTSAAQQDGMPVASWIKVSTGI